MFIYNITIKVDWSIHEAWLAWLKEEHMAEVVATGCFEGGNLLRLKEIDDTEGPTYAVQFIAATREAYEQYIERHADLLRKKSFDKWGDRFIAFRSLMELVK
jgi:hypothetical protein